MRDVYVIGIGQTVFGKHDTLHVNDLGAAAAQAALQDAEISPKDLEAAYCGTNMYKGTPAQSILQRLGVSRIRMYNVENACASGSSAVDLLHQQVIALPGVMLPPHRMPDQRPLDPQTVHCSQQIIRQGVGGAARRPAPQETVHVEKGHGSPPPVMRAGNDYSAGSRFKNRCRNMR